MLLFIGFYLRYTCKKAILQEVKIYRNLRSTIEIGESGEIRKYFNKNIKCDNTLTKKQTWEKKGRA